MSIAQSEQSNQGAMEVTIPKRPTNIVLSREFTHSAKNKGTSNTSLGWDQLDKTKFYINSTIMGVVLRGVFYPPGLVKTRMQMQNAASEGAYKSMGDAFKQIIKKEGFMALYKGFGTNTLGIAATHIYSTSYEVSRQAFLKNVSDNTVAASLVAGGTASLVGQTVVVPIDIISQKMMVSKSSKGDAQKPVAIAKSIVRSQGIRGLYRGYIASLATYGPASAVWWGSYGAVCQPLLNIVASRREDDIPHWQKSMVQSFSGLIAGVSAGFLTNPMDVVRTRVQVYGDRSTMEVLKLLMKEEGPKALGRGAVARASQMGPIGAVTLPMYEFLKHISQKE